jgi:hypothetical protein
MSDYEDYDFGDAEEGPRKPRGLSRETVEQIKWAVLGMDVDSREHRPPTSAPTDEHIVTPPNGRGPDGRYQPGHSGNDGGRRRKRFTAKVTPLPELDADLLAELVKAALARKVTVNRDGVPVERTVHEVIVDVQSMKALKGSTSAARYLEGLNQRAQKLEAQRRARDYAHWSDRKARYTALQERAKRRGLAIDWECPHPDDIILGPGHEVTIVGPMTPADLIQTRKMYERARYWLTVSVYETWLQKRRKRTHRHCPHIHAGVVSCYIFQVEQQLLPPRLRMATKEMEDKVLKFSQTGGRALHDLLRAEAQKVGMPVPPRALRIPFTLAHPLSEELIPEVPVADQPVGAELVSQDTSAADVLKLAWAELMKTQTSGGP